MADVRVKDYFYCKSGMVLTNYHDLILAFKQYAEGNYPEHYKFHKSRHDYSNWLRDILSMGELAKKIDAEQNPKKVLEILKAERKVEGFDSMPEIGQESVADDVEIQQVDAEHAEELLSKVKKMKHSSFNPVVDEVSLGKLQDLYDALYSQISDYRRQGKDVFIPGLLLRNVKPKISYYKATQEKADFDNVIREIENIKQELKEAVQKEEPDLKQEIMSKVKELKEGEDGV